MTTSENQLQDAPPTDKSAGKAAKVAVRVVVGLMLLFLGLEAISLVVSQQTEQRRMDVGMAGGQCETAKRVPGWLAVLAGDDFHTFMDYPEIMAVTLKGDKINDANLARLPSLPGLKKLELQDTLITSEGLKLLSRWQSIETLNLGNTPVTDITPLTELPQLQALLLNFSQVRREHLSGLSKLANLKELGAGYIQVTDAEVVEIAKCQKLVLVSIAASQLGEHGLAPLASLPELKTLVLKDASFSADDLKALQASKPDLEVLK